MPRKEDNGVLDRPRLRRLADSLAIALVYLSAIDDAVDPFDDIDPDLAWRICSLTSTAKHLLFNGITSGAFESPTSLIIQAAQNRTDIEVRETELYHDCLNAVRLIARSVQ